MASTNADAVHFPKGVFPPDADSGKGESVPLTHPHGSGGIPKGGESVGSPPLGCILLVLFCCITEKYTSNTSEFVTASGHQGQRTYFLKTLFADVRRVHFSTVGGLHGVRPPRLKNSFSKNVFRRRSASTLRTRRRPPRREPAKAKELFFKKRFPPTFGEYTSPPSVAVHGECPRGQRTFLAYRHMQYASPPRRAPAKGKELFLTKKQSPQASPAGTAKIQL